MVFGLSLVFWFWVFPFVRESKMPSADRILCVILTSPSSEKKMTAVKDTWSKRCDSRLFVVARKSGAPMLQYPFLYVNTTESRNHLTEKIMLAFSYVYKHLLTKFDWILKADDDTYILVENLRHLLSQYNSSQMGYAGYHFKTHMRHGYMSGGAGYVISHAAFQKLGETCFQTKPCVKRDKNEDVEVGLLLQDLNVYVLSSLDNEGRETFHPEPLDKHAVGPFPRWLDQYGWNKPQYGENCCSELSISFHHLSHSEIYLYDLLLYRIRVNGKKIPTSTSSPIKPTSSPSSVSAPEQSATSANV